MKRPIHIQGLCDRLTGVVYAVLYKYANGLSCTACQQSWAWALEKLLLLAQFGIGNSLKKFKLHTVYAVILEAIKPLQLVGQVAEFKFGSKFEPLLVIWQSLQRLFQKVIDSEGLEGKIWVNCQALGAALQLCLCRSDRWAQTQGVPESAAVAAGSDHLAWGKHATTLALLAQFKSQQGFNAL